MSCWPWGERGVLWVKRGVWAKSGVWGRKEVFGGVKGCLGYIFFSTKVPGRDKAGPACPGESRLTNTT